MSDPMMTPRRPRIAVFGEFSSGKSTLINALTGQGVLPTRTTATHMPAVWLAWGDAPWVVVGQDGTEREITREELFETPVEGTAYVRVFAQVPLLRECDLIDTPGNADPNIAAENWQRMVAEMDGAIWCSAATNAWRQSELAAWKEMPVEMREKSVLLLTRADKIETEKDRAKIMRRVGKDAGRYFKHIHMVSALDPGTMQDFLADLVNLCRKMSGGAALEDREGLVTRLLEADGDAAPAEAEVQAAPEPKPFATPTRPEPLRSNTRLRRNVAAAGVMAEAGEMAAVEDEAEDMGASEVEAALPEMAEEDIAEEIVAADEAEFVAEADELPAEAEADEGYEADAAFAEETDDAFEAADDGDEELPLEAGFEDAAEEGETASNGLVDEAELLRRLYRQRLLPAADETDDEDQPVALDDDMAAEAAAAADAVAAELNGMAEAEDEPAGDMPEEIEAVAAPEPEPEPQPRQRRPVAPEVEADDVASQLRAIVAAYAAHTEVEAADDADEEINVFADDAGDEAEAGEDEMLFADADEAADEDDTLFADDEDETEAAGEPSFAVLPRRVPTRVRDESDMPARPAARPIDAVAKVGGASAAWAQMVARTGKFQGIAGDPDFQEFLSMLDRVVGEEPVEDIHDGDRG